METISVVFIVKVRLRLNHACVLKARLKSNHAHVPEARLRLEAQIGIFLRVVYLIFQHRKIYLAFAFD